VKVRPELAICAALLLVGSCGNMGAPPHAGQPTVQAQSMQSMLIDINQMREFVYGGGSQSAAQTAADDLVSWSARMGELFPPGQATTDYVDMSPQRVRDAPGAMSQTAGSLRAAVRTGNRAVIGDQLARTEKNGCGVCHLSNTH
jgi:cytochrome c'